MEVRLARVALLMFGSGLCALVYQIAWMRELRLVFGMSTAASAAVLAIFMGGLGLGGLLIGRRADRHPNPLALYGKLEIIVAISAAISPVLIWFVRQGYVELGGTTVLGLGFGTIVRLLLSVLVLGLPTFAMGGTLPAVARAVEHEADSGRRNLAVLYGVNALGAVTGVILATFFGIEIFGIRQMLWIACLLNGLVGLAAISHARYLSVGPRESTVDSNAAVDSGDLEAHTVAQDHTPAWFVLMAAGLVGFSFLLMELVWYRMLAPILGGSLYTFGLILAIALLGIGVGGAYYSLVGRRRGATLAGFGVTCALEAAFLVVPFALGDRIAVLAVLLQPLSILGFSGSVIGWALITGIVVFPAAILSGIQFPMLISLLGKGRKDVGRHTGAAYASNTAGCIVGSLAGGFGVLPLLTAPGSWLFAAVLLALLGIAAVVFSFLNGSSLTRHHFYATGASAIAILLCFSQGPTSAWRHSPIGVGHVSLANSSANGVVDFLNRWRRTVFWESEGLESSVGMTAKDGVAFVINGKSDGHSRGDAPTTVMSGLIGPILHPNPRTGLVIGLGIGSTAGWMAAVPFMERVDVAELEPDVMDVARECSSVNQNLLENDKINIYFGDARELLLTTPERYDIVYSQPSNPYRAGIASLFTIEFYRAVAERLAEGGQFHQWLQAYEVDNITIKTVITTLRAVFPYIETWETKRGDLLLVCSQIPIEYDVERLRRRVSTSPIREGLLAVWRATDLEGFLAHFVARSSLADGIASENPDLVSTDDQTLVEFGFARGVGRDRLFKVEDLKALAHLRAEDRPVTIGGEVDWERVEDERVSTSAAVDIPPVALVHYDSERRARTATLAAFVQGNHQKVLSAWRRQSREPTNPVEIAALAEAFADSGSEQALPYIRNLARWEPVEADLVTARLRLRQGRLEEATSLLESGFIRYRVDPWPIHKMVSRALDLAVAIAHKDHALGRRLYEVLQEPFAVRLLNERRIKTGIEIARQVDFSGMCSEAMGRFEPHVPWNRDYLTMRYLCYLKTHNQAEETARQDLMSFTAAASESFALDLEPSR